MEPEWPDAQSSIRLTPERVLAFQGIMERCYGVHLEFNEAAARAAKLIALYRAVLGPIPEDPGRAGGQ